MQLAKRSIAIRRTRHQNAKGHDICQLIHRHSLVLHLPPDGISRFHAAANAAFQPDAGQRILQFNGNRGDGYFRLGCEKIEAVNYALPHFAIQHRKRIILKFLLDPCQPDPLGQRRKDIHRLARNALLLVGLLDE